VADARPDAADKPVLRRTLLTRRQAIPRPERRRADEATWDALRAFLIELLRPGGCAAVHRPFGSEPCAALEPELPERVSSLTSGVDVLLPFVLSDNDLDWLPLGAAEPVGVDAVRRADVVVVPGLAVAGDGVRLGRGGGSYDRALARLRPGTPVVAVLRAGEHPVAVPAESHDLPVSAVVTDEGLITIDAVR
jgi:5-formyltetrahydrofolate cyclo-ligase